MDPGRPTVYFAPARQLTEVRVVLHDPARLVALTARQRHRHRRGRLRPARVSCPGSPWEHREHLRPASGRHRTTVTTSANRFSDCDCRALSPRGANCGAVPMICRECEAGCCSRCSRDPPWRSRRRRNRREPTVVVHGRDGDRGVPEGHWGKTAWTAQRQRVGRALLLERCRSAGRPLGASCGGIDPTTRAHLLMYGSSWSAPGTYGRDPRIRHRQGEEGRDHAREADTRSASRRSRRRPGWPATSASSSRSSRVGRTRSRPSPSIAAATW